jgi:hypothetical protein
MIETFIIFIVLVKSFYHFGGICEALMVVWNEKNLYEKLPFGVWFGWGISRL